MARVVAFSLFGKLSLRVGHTDIFRESLHSNIISVLLHLDDSDNEVKAVSILNIFRSICCRYVPRHLKTLNRRLHLPRSLL